jgi:hypothetical protein
MTDLSRRGVLGAGAVGVVLAPLVTATEAAAAASRNLYGRKRFKRMLNKKFRLGSGPGSARVRLVRVSNLPSSPRGDTRQFALTFKAKTAGPPQGTYTLRRKGFASTSLFVVPDARRRTYHAVVNRGR